MNSKPKKTLFPAFQLTYDLRMFCQKLVKIDPTGNKSYLFAKMAGLLQNYMDCSKKEIIFFSYFFNLVIGITNIFKIIGDVKELIVHFNALHTHHRPIKNRNTHQEKNAYHNAESPDFHSCNRSAVNKPQSNGHCSKENNPNCWHSNFYNYRKGRGDILHF